MTTSEAMIGTDTGLESIGETPAAEDEGRAQAAATLEALRSELAQTVNDDLDAGFDAAVAIATEVVGGKLLFSLPAAGLLKDAMRVAPVWLSSGDDQTIVFVVLDASGKSARVAGSDGEMAEVARFACSFVDVIGKLRDCEFAQAEAA